MVVVAGCDIGSLTAKIVVLEIQNEKIEKKYSHIQKVGYAPGQVASQLISKAKSVINGEKIEYIVSTGYGRKLVEEAQKSITEITCHALGAHHSNASIQTIIDIGGQDSKVILLNEQAHVQDFEMNDKCSAGSGRFLEVMADALEIPLEEFGSLALTSKNPSPISSTCTVFAESEVISRINQGASRVDVAAGIHKAIVNKTIALSARVGIQPEVALTGGVALNPAVKEMLEIELGTKIIVPSEPQMNGALGAALLARRYFQKTIKNEKER